MRQRSSTVTTGLNLEGEAVLGDPYGVTITDDESDPFEQRFVTVGMSAKGVLLVVVYTCDDSDNVRIISARPATNQERTEYEERL